MSFTGWLWSVIASASGLKSILDMINTNRSQTSNVYVYPTSITHLWLYGLGICHVSHVARSSKNYMPCLHSMLLKNTPIQLENNVSIVPSSMYVFIDQSYQHNNSPMLPIFVPDQGYPMIFNSRCCEDIIPLFGYVMDWLLQPLLRWTTSKQHPRLQSV